MIYSQRHRNAIDRIAVNSLTHQQRDSLVWDVRESVLRDSCHQDIGHRSVSMEDWSAQEGQLGDDDRWSLPLNNNESMENGSSLVDLRFFFFLFFFFAAGLVSSPSAASSPSFSSSKHTLKIDRQHRSATYLLLESREWRCFLFHWPPDQSFHFPQLYWRLEQWNREDLRSRLADRCFTFVFLLLLSFLLVLHFGWIVDFACLIDFVVIRILRSILKSLIIFFFHYFRCHVAHARVVFTSNRKKRTACFLFRQLSFETNAYQLWAVSLHEEVSLRCRHEHLFLD